MKKITVICLFLLLSFRVCCQIDTLVQNSAIIDEVIDAIEWQTIDIEDEEDVEELLDFQIEEEKYNINDLTEPQAFLFLKLTDYQYYHLKKYIYESGELLSLYELAAVEGFDREMVMKLLPYIYVKPVITKKRYFSKFFPRSKQKLLLRYGQILEPKLGYDTTRNSHYLGTPQRLMFKYTFTSGDNFSLGIAGEKDAGEQWGRSVQKYGFDFYSGHIQIKNISWLKSLILGDYRVSIGQGLLLGNGLRMGSGTVEGARQMVTTLRPITAMNESQFFRGIAVELGNYRYLATMFCSFRFYDAQLNDTIAETPFLESALSVGGYHRTDTEISKRKTVPCWVYGGNFMIRFPRFKIGVSALSDNYLYPNYNSGNLYQLYCFTGNKGGNISIDYQLVVKNSVLFGEVATTFQGAPAILQGAIVKLHPRLHLSLLFRYYGKHYYATYGGAYSRNTQMNNEMGLLLNAKLFLLPKLSLNLSSDFYQIFWLKYRLDKPSRYADFSLKAEWSPARTLSGIFQYKYYHLYQNFSNQYYNNIVDLPSHKLGVTLKVFGLGYFSLKTGVNFIFVKHQNGKKMSGMLLYQDFCVKFPKPNFSFIARVALFDTDSYNERLYAYENDLTQTFTIASYYGKGMKFYAICQYKWRFISFQIKISRLLFRDRNSVGSGLEEIKANHKTEVKGQIILSF